MEKSKLKSMLDSLNLSAMVRSLRANAKGQGVASMQYQTISELDLDALVYRVMDVKEVGLALDKQDIDLILNIVQSYAHMVEKLKNHKVTVNHLRKELGIKPRRESLKELSKDLKNTQNFAADSDFTLDDVPLDDNAVSENAVSENADSENADSENADSENAIQKNEIPKINDNRFSKKTSSDSKPSKRNGKRTAEDFEKAKTEYHALTHIGSGDTCSHCTRGRFYKYEPAHFIRITGQAPLQATQHLSERMRCNACGIYEAAPLPAEVLADGDPGQMYGYTARSVMAIHKFLAGHPYHRQESLSEILGCPVAASTAFEQCEKLADSIQTVHTALITNASTAYHYNIDDTRNRILDAEPKLINKRNGKGQNLRTAVYTSALIATLIDEKMIAIYKTNIGHAGELIDSVLKNRPVDMPAPLVMSDALSWNKPTVRKVIPSLCMVHGRRQFCDIFEEDSAACCDIIAKMDKFFDFDREAKTKGLDANARLIWHQRHSLPLMEEMKASFTTSMASKEVESNSNLGSAMNYFLKHYTGLVKFCEVPGARLHNNLVEGIIRMVVLGRKNSFFYKTSAGAAVADVIMSVGVTAQLNGINVFDYFNDLQRYSEEVKSNVEAWLPWHYRNTRSLLH